METCENLNSSKDFQGFSRFSKYPVMNHITWIHRNLRDSSWIHVGYMEMYGNPHVFKLSMWYYVDRTAKKIRDDIYIYYNLSTVRSVLLNDRIHRTSKTKLSNLIIEFDSHDCSVTACTMFYNLFENFV